jgi:hypothetical protein
MTLCIFGIIVVVLVVIGRNGSKIRATKDGIEVELPDINFPTKGLA